MVRDTFFMVNIMCVCGIPSIRQIQIQSLQHPQTVLTEEQVVPAGGDATLSGRFSSTHQLEMFRLQNSTYVTIITDISQRICYSQEIHCKQSVCKGTFNCIILQILLLLNVL